MVIADQMVREGVNAPQENREEKCVFQAEGTASNSLVSTLYFLEEKCIYSKE